MGATGVASSMAIDEQRGWVLGAADTGRLFVLDMDTGRLKGDISWGARLAARRWAAGSGYWFPGSSAIAIVPSQGVLYIGGTDYESAWQGQFKGQGKAFLL